MTLDSFLHGARTDTQPSVFQTTADESIAEVHQSNTDFSYNQPVTNHKSHRMYTQVLPEEGPVSPPATTLDSPFVRHALTGAVIGLVVIQLLKLNR